ncbi:MAG: hypothetical protein CMJ90_03735 [Planctomycetes bacterium]|nr:hypothetical protein [Planctomycetota bacterium]
MVLQSRSAVVTHGEAGLPSRTWALHPVGEGRFTVADEGLIDELVERHQAVFRYIDTSGATPEYPENPNGSMGHVAGICDPTGQVLGLMPHPERALFPWHHPAWTREPKRDEGDGASLFRAAVQAMR